MVINEFYTKNIERIKEHYEQEGYVMLQQFLTTELELPTKLATKKNPLLHSYKEAEFNLPHEIKDYIKQITGKEITSAKFKEFEAGDYQLRTHNRGQQLFVILDVTKDFPENAGGNIHFIDENGESFIFPPSNSTLIIFNKKENLDFFVEYCNHYATKREVIFSTITL